MNAPLETVTGALPDAVRRQALDLADAVAKADGVAAFGETARQALVVGDSAVTHVLAWVEGRLVGYGQRDARSTSAELAVVPTARRHGLGQAQATELMLGAPQVRWWAHGDLPAARALASRLGLKPVREMVLMCASLPSRLATERTAPPPDMAWRNFEPDQDQAAWVELNAAIFADHPEQGAITLDGLAWRMRQDWFDPSGFFLVESTEPPGQTRLLGYHWTKVQERVGEVYAIGVLPEARGKHLGTALFRRGLEHLARAGIEQVELYVEADNSPALAVYQRQGFQISERHVQYAR